MAASFEVVAKQFVEFYYQTFDDEPNRKNLAGVYRETSMLTFESSQTQGVMSIVEKLTTLPLGAVKHEITTLDAQPSNENGGVLVVVTGNLQTEGEKPKSYIQTFQLLPIGESFYVHNDVFRLVY